MTGIFKFTTLIISAMSTAACAVVPKNEITTEVLLPATPNQVWEVLIDGSHYSDWNPFIINIEGRFEKGETLKNTMQPTHDNQLVFRPKILEAKPNEELRWLGHIGIPGIFDGEHYFLLRTHDNQTKLTHGEKFSGFALWFINTDQYLDNLNEMNAALSTRLIELQK